MELENELQLVMSVIGAVRRLKAKHSVKDKPEGDTYIYTEWPKKMYTHFDMKNITL
jgi:hypothetical protein